MKNICYKTSGTCCRQINIDVDDDGIIRNIAFLGGCNGNLQGIGRLVVGQKASEVRDRLAGLKCGVKQTSCPDQLSKALEEVR